MVNRFQEQVGPVDLPSGRRADDYRLPLVVRITDKYGTYAEHEVHTAVCLLHFCSVSNTNKPTKCVGAIPIYIQNLNGLVASMYIASPSAITAKVF